MAKVSVQVPCYNSEKYIYETIKSVLDQTFQDFEIIVVDDGSVDGSGDIIKNFRDPRIKYVYQENAGLSNARNKAVSLSSGEYIAFLDHDDIWLPDKLERQVSVLDGDPEIALVYSNYYKIFSDGAKILGLAGPQPEGNAFEALLYNYTVGLVTAMVRKKALDELGSIFDTSLNVCEDLDVFMRVLYRRKAAYLDEPLALYRIHDKRSSLIFKDRYADEYEHVINKLIKMDPSISDKYGAALRYASGTIGHLRAKLAMANGNSKEARNYLLPYRHLDHKFRFLYLLTFLPPAIWQKVHNVKNKGVFF